MLTKMLGHVDLNFSIVVWLIEVLAFGWQLDSGAVKANGLTHAYSSYPCHAASKS